MCTAGQRRVRIDIGYCGTEFFGSQRQPGVRTVQSVLEEALRQLTGASRRLQFAGRTDRGVHAVGQVATGVVEWPKDLEQLRHGLDSLTSQDLVVYAVSEVDDSFEARFSAVRREYRYRIWNAERRPVFLHGIAWWVREPLDIDRLNRVASMLPGEQDFRSFTGKGDGSGTATRNTVRIIDASAWHEAKPDIEPGGRLLEYRITGNSFLPHMVRNLVGSMIEVGYSRKDRDWFQELIEVRDRRQAPPPAPPDGLVLWNVCYDDDERQSNAAGAGDP